MNIYIYRVDFQGLSPLGVPQLLSYATKGYCTRPTHPTMPNVFVDGRVKNPLLFRRDLYGQEALYGDGEVGHGQVVLINSDGALDALMDYMFDNAIVEVWRINETALDTDVLVFRGRVEQITADEIDVNLLVRDPTYSFDVAIQTRKYGGTNVLPNGLDGVAGDIKGQPRPICYGKVFSISPVLVNTSRLIYEVHYTQFNTGWTLAAYDSGVALTQGANYTSQADMETNAPAGGQYRVWTAAAGSYVRLGSSPAGHVTMDVSNPTASGSLAWHAIIGELYAHPTAIDNRVSASYSTAGVYWQKEEITFYQAFRELARNVGASFQIYPDSVGTGILVGGGTAAYITLQRLEVPIVGTTPVLTLDQTNIMAVKRIRPDTKERGIAPWRVLVRYHRNWTVLADADLAGSVVSGSLSSEYVTAKVDNSTTLSLNPNAPQMSVDTQLTTEADATAHANYYQTLLAPGLAMYVVITALDSDEMMALTSTSTPPPQINGLMLNSPVKVTYPRHGLSAGKLLAIVGYSVDHDEMVAEIVLWG